MKTEMIVSVFGSSRPRENDSDYAEARELGRALAQKGFAICTGAYGGTMEAVSRGAKEAGGKTYGVTAEFFPAAKANEWVDVEVRVKTWQDRLFEIIRLGDGICRLQRRHRHFSGTGGGLGNDEQVGDAGQTVCGARRILGAHFALCARKWKWARKIPGPKGRRRF